MSDEYNKIHALAQARKYIVDLFGTDLISLWPMTSPTLITWMSNLTCTYRATES